MSDVWASALRRGGILIALGLVCFVLSWPAIEDLGPLLVGLGAILVILGLIVTLATARTLTAEKQRIGPRV